jgi:beta-aspartyl-peptidase (threonine type)
MPCLVNETRCRFLTFMIPRSVSLLFCLATCAAAEAPITLVLHGGAGAGRQTLSAEKEAAGREVMEEALRVGFAVLKAGGSSQEAVQTAVVVLEDSPLFNAGRGAVLTAVGSVELDASIMVGETGLAGGVASVQGVRNPIRLAEKVMLKTPHVLMIGEGAEALAREEQLRFEEPAWFITPEQQARFERLKKNTSAVSPLDESSRRMGTVGAVALDRAGNLAAATSTGGLAGKRVGRVGDSPLIGAGTYAENGVCAVSCTGHGEFFIRNLVAYDVAARMKYAGVSLAAAAEEIVNQKLVKLDARGGLIAVDAEGRISTPFNSDGMWRAWMGADGVAHVAVFAD